MRSAGMRAASVVAILVALAVPPPAAAQDSPSAALDRGAAAPGDTVLVTGQSWPDATVVQAQLCGNQALNGSVDCDRSAALTVGVGADGRFGVMLPVTVPPAPCPCVVLVTSPDVVISGLRLPIDVTGAPTAEPSQALASVPIFSITKLHVTGGRSLRSLFGLGEDRSVVMTVENLGGVTIDALPITVADASAPDEIIGTGTLDGLEPGRSVKVRVAFAVPALAVGTTTLNVTVDQSGQASASTTSFSTFPWGLALLLFVMVAVASLVLTRRRRAHRRPTSAAASTAGGDDARALGPAHLSADERAAGPAHLSEGGPPLTHTTARRERDLSHDLTRLLAEAIRDVGPIPPSADTDQLAEQMAIVIVSELRDHHDLDLGAEVALTSSISDELARELRQLTGTRS